MKKFFVLAVILCAVIFPSSASATLTTDEQILCNNMNEFLKYANSGYETAEQRRLKEEQARREEFYRLVFTTALTVGLIALFLAYKRSEDRQFIVEHSLAIWLASFVGGKNFWLLIFCVVSLVTCLVYVPYNLISSNNAAVAIKTAHSTIFEPPKDFNPRLTKIDYEAITFREVLILLGCCAGATTCKLLRRRQDDWH